jgi:hypothetical protein
MKHIRQVSDIAKSVIKASEKKSVPMLPLMVAIVGLIGLLGYAMHLLAAR